MWLKPFVDLREVDRCFLVFFHHHFLRRFAIVAAIMPMLVPVEAIMMRSAAVILWMALVGTTISQPGATFVLLTHLGDHAVQVVNVGVALLGIAAVSNSLVDIVTGFLALFEGYRIGVEHGSVDFHGPVVLRHYDAVAVTQDDVIIATWVR